MMEFKTKDSGGWKKIRKWMEKVEGISVRQEEKEKMTQRGICSKSGRMRELRQWK